MKYAPRSGFSFSALPLPSSNIPEANKYPPIASIFALSIVPAPGEDAPWYPAHLGGHAPDRAEALGLDDVPRSAVPPTWGPPTIRA